MGGGFGPIEEEMTKGKSSNYFTNPCRVGNQEVNESSFEQMVARLHLAPEQYAGSRELRAWVRRNKSFKYVPPDLLASFGFKPGAEV